MVIAVLAEAERIPNVGILASADNAEWIFSAPMQNRKRNTMKTLNEVIVALEVCTSGYCSHPKHGDCPYLDERNDCDTRQRKLDALHYLREYKKYNDTICALPDYYEWVHSTDNPPLTWDELRTMEGKPVWIEYGTDEDTALKRWCLVQIVLDQYISLATTAIFFRAEKSKQGKTWQAYRKERNESDR